MEISEEQILDVVNSTISAEQFEGSIIYWDRQMLEEGQHVRAGPKSIEMPFDGMVVFVDLAPRYNWAHPCLYVLVNVEDLSTEVIRASFPPFTDEYPESVIVLQRYGKEPPHDRYFEVYD